MNSKCCTGCERVLPLEDFPADASKSDGHHTRCRSCKRGSSRTRPSRAQQERQNRLAEARQAALERLAERHEQEFVKLYYTEAVSRGLVEPQGSVGDRGRMLVA